MKRYLQETKNQESERIMLYSNTMESSTQNPSILVESKQPHFHHHHHHQQPHGEIQSLMSLEGKKAIQESNSKLSKNDEMDNKKNEEQDQKCSGSERLKRHRSEVAGSVWIPELWGQEELLKDWIDCSAFEASLVPKSIMSARSALVQEGRRANSSSLRIENRC